jgi:hypothetical protein
MLHGQADGPDTANKGRDGALVDIASGDCNIRPPEVERWRMEQDQDSEEGHRGKTPRLTGSLASTKHSSAVEDLFEGPSVKWDTEVRADRASGRGRPLAEIVVFPTAADGENNASHHRGAVYSRYMPPNRTRIRRAVRSPRYQTTS